MLVLFNEFLLTHYSIMHPCLSNLLVTCEAALVMRVRRRVSWHYNPTNQSVMLPLMHAVLQKRMRVKVQVTRAHAHANTNQTHERRAHATATANRSHVRW